MTPARLGAAVALVAVLAVPARADEAAAVTSTVVPKDAWASVDSRAVTKADVQRRVQLLRALAGAIPVGPPPLELALESLVVETLVQDRLDRDGVGPGSVSADELAKAREDFVRHAGPGDLRARLEADGLKLEDVDPMLRVNLAFKKRVDRDATPEALQAAFERHKLELAGEVRAIDVRVSVRNGDFAGALATAQATLAQLAADGSNAAALARQTSDDPNAPLTSGDTDWFPARPRPPGERPSPHLPPEVVRACFALGKAGPVYQPVLARDGFHVLYVTGTRFVSPPAFADFEKRIREGFLVEHALELHARWRAEARIAFAPDAPRGGPGAGPR